MLEGGNVGRAEAVRALAISRRAVDVNCIFVVVGDG
jgi:hypothetical protein